MQREVHSLSYSIYTCWNIFLKFRRANFKPEFRTFRDTNYFNYEYYIILYIILYILLYNHIILYSYFILIYVYYIVYSLADSVNTADSLDPARCAASQLSNTMLSSKTRKFQKASIQLCLLAPCHWPTQFEGRIWPDCSLDFSMWIGNLAALLGLTGDSRSGGFHLFGDVWDLPGAWFNTPGYTPRWRLCCRYPQTMDVHDLSREAVGQSQKILCPHNFACP